MKTLKTLIFETKGNTIKKVTFKPNHYTPETNIDVVIGEYVSAAGKLRLLRTESYKCPLSGLMREVKKAKKNVWHTKLLSEY